MNIVNWDESLSVGIDKIDDQHKWLINLINKLHDNMLKYSEDLMNKSILELYDYTMTHFADEEKLMVESKYRAMSYHKREHETFIKTLNRIFSKFNRKEEHITESVVVYLIDWLVDHISTTDKSLGVYLKSKSFAVQ